MENKARDSSPPTNDEYAPLDRYEESENHYLDLNRKKGTYFFHGSVPKALISGQAEYQYRIDGNKVLVRLLSECVDRTGETTWYVANNVVLESEIRKKHSGGLFQIRTPEEIIEKYRKKTDWHEIEDPNHRNFILLRHPEILPVFDFKKHLQQEIERIKCKSEIVLGKLKDLGFKIKETEKGLPLNSIEPTPDDKAIKNLQKLFETESLNKIGITEHELEYRNLVLADLESWIKKASA